MAVWCGIAAEGTLFTGGVGGKHAVAIGNQPLCLTSYSPTLQPKPVWGVTYLEVSPTYLAPKPHSGRASADAGGKLRLFRHTWHDMIVDTCGLAITRDFQIDRPEDL